MKNYYLFLILIFISNCSLNKVENSHGTPFLESKEKNLIVGKTNSNDILNTFGPPSTTSYFDNDMWIYIEKTTTKSSLIKLGKNRNLKSNILVLEIDKKGILFTKKLYTLNDIKDLKFSDSVTTQTEKDTFVYGFISSLKQKIDSPKRRKKSSKKQ